MDLSLPDKRGEELIKSMMALKGNVPIIALTGYSDLNFATRSISSGLSDYLIKEDLTPTILYKSVVYNIERYRYIKTIKESERRYSDLFQLSPIPMWVYDIETLRFLDVNQSAIRHYGYSKEEFLSMTIMEIRPEEEIAKLEEAIRNSKEKENHYFEGEFRHKNKSGREMIVDIRSNPINYGDRKAEVVLAHDITERVLHERTIEKQNEKLKDIAWIQSHVVRAPLARMMGLIKLLTDHAVPEGSEEEYLQHILNSAYELDEIIRELAGKTRQIKDKSEIE